MVHPKPLTGCKKTKPAIRNLLSWFRTVPEADTLTPVDLNLINDLWVPNVFIYNLKTFKVIL